MSSNLLLTWDTGSLWLGDVTRSEVHESILTPTSHPVENVPNVSDAARRQLDSFSCEVFVTNQPFDDPNQLYGAYVGSITVKPSYYKAPPYLNPGGALVGAVENLLSPNDGSFTVTTTLWPAAFDAVKDTRDKLVWLQDNRKLLQVSTPKATYANMILERCTMTRDRPVDGAPFKLEFRQLRVVTVGYSEIPLPANPAKTPQKAKGKQQPSVQPDPPKDGVVWTALFGD